MPIYQYVAKDQSSRTVSGTLDAADERAAAAALRNSSLWPMRIHLAGPGAPSPAAPAPAAPQVAPPGRGAAQAAHASRAMPAQAPLPPSVPHVPAGGATHGGPLPQAPALPVAASPAGGVSVRDLSIYFRQLATAVRSGMPLSRCMEIMRDQSRGTLARLSCEAAAAVQRGQTLSSTFTRYPRVFSPLVLALVQAGEVGGLLDDVLLRIADLLERQHLLNQKIRQQTLYPKFILGAAVAIPIATRIILSKVAPTAQTSFGSISIPVVGGVVGVLVALVLLNRMARHARWLDWLKLKLPLLGKVTHQLALAHFSRALASLYRAGVPFAQAVGTSAAAAGNRHVTETLLSALPAVHRGERLSTVLAPTRILNPMTLNMLRTGEETGNVDEMLDKVAEYSETEAEGTIKQITTILGPALMILIGIVVGAEVIRFYVGQFNMYMDFDQQ